MTNTILDIKDLNKRYGDIQALSDVGFSLKRGDVLGLLGPNGAGKTTLISILSGTMTDFSGEVSFDGKDLFSDRFLRKRLGIVPQDMAFYDDLNAVENLMFWGGFYDIPKSELKKRIKKQLEIVNLSDRSKEPVKNFSGGMKRRLNIAIGMIHEPDLILFDEPTVGIDVQAKVSILEVIKSLGESGVSVIFTSHQLAEVEEICSDIVIMDRGRKLEQGTLKELIQIVGEKEIVEIEGSFAPDDIASCTSDLSYADPLLIKENFCSFAFEDSSRIPSMMETLFKHRIKLYDLKIKSPNLESVFLKLTGRSLRD